LSLFFYFYVFFFFVIDKKNQLIEIRFNIYLFWNVLLGVVLSFEMLLFPVLRLVLFSLCELLLYIKLFETRDEPSRFLFNLLLLA